MTVKRIIIFIAAIVFTCFAFEIGKRILLGHYREKADVALFLSGDYKTAIEYYDKLISWRPNAAGYYYNRGDAYADSKQFDKAIADYKRSLELGINDSLQAILRIALNAKKQDSLLLEESSLKKLLEMSKNKSVLEYWAANYHLGQLEYKRKNYQKAIDDYNIAHLTRPSYLEIYHRANAYYALGKIDSARQDLHETIKFAKEDYIKKSPNSYLAKCDSCAFPFGTEEYEMLTDGDNQTILQTLEKSDEARLKEITTTLRNIEKNSK